jgi:thiosulfate/3-mercaptopyruvate sulfurtransferase
MSRLFVFGTLATLLTVLPSATVAGQTAAAANDPGPLVSTDWLAQHLDDPAVRVIATGDEGRYTRGHIPGARFLEHMDTLGPGHHLLPADALATALTKAGAADGMRIVLYGDTPMITGWVFMALASVGHASAHSMLDGSKELRRSENRPVSTEKPAAATGRLTARAAPDVAVDAKWVRSQLESPSVRLLDVRTTNEWNDGHLPGATLVLWPDLFADQRNLKFKSQDELRALFARAGVKPGQLVVTYCAVGMRASLMYWAALRAGLPARVYVGSWQDWSRDSTNPVVR